MINMIHTSFKSKIWRGWKLMWSTLIGLTEDNLMKFVFY